MRVLSLPTVKHTGSNFVLSLLGGEYLNIKRGYVGEGVYFDHLWPHKRGLWKPLLDQMPCIVPLRHPDAVAGTWAARNRDLNDLIREWRELEWLSANYAPYFLPVDTSDRDQHLQRINEGLGLSLKTDWEPVRSKGSAPVKSPVWLPLFDRFYSRRLG